MRTVRVRTRNEARAELEKAIEAAASRCPHPEDRLRRPSPNWSGGSSDDDAKLIVRGHAPARNLKRGRDLERVRIFVRPTSRPIAV